MAQKENPLKNTEILKIYSGIGFDILSDMVFAKSLLKFLLCAKIEHCHINCSKDEFRLHEKLEGQRLSGIWVFPIHSQPRIVYYS